MVLVLVLVCVSIHKAQNSKSNMQPRATSQSQNAEKGGHQTRFENK